jgi:hypothetical protein
MALVKWLVIVYWLTSDANLAIIDLSTLEEYSSSVVSRYLMTINGLFLTNNKEST